MKPTSASSDRRIDARLRRCGHAIAVGAWLFCIGGAFAQGSLTDEFARMSPRERARVAQQEQEESRNDAPYQAKMTQGEALFQQSRYEEAMVVFEEARIMRPLNVYPKVKIEDLKVLIRQRDERIAAEQDKTEVSQALPANGPENGPALPDKPASALETALDVGQGDTGAPIVLEPSPADSSSTSPLQARSIEGTPTSFPARKQMVRAKPALRTEHAGEAPPPPTSPPPDGVVENRYKQGSAQVTEMMVTRNGRTTVFKRVAHKYGQVYYFEDGQAIDGRVWRERFGDKP